MSIQIQSSQIKPVDRPNNGQQCPKKTRLLIGKNIEKCTELSYSTLERQLGTIITDASILIAQQEEQENQEKLDSLFNQLVNDSGPNPVACSTQTPAEKLSAPSQNPPVSVLANTTNFVQPHISQQQQQQQQTQHQNQQVLLNYYNQQNPSKTNENLQQQNGFITVQPQFLGQYGLNVGLNGALVPIVISNSSGGNVAVPVQQLVQQTYATENQSASFKTSNEWFHQEIDFGLKGSSSI